LLLHLRGLLPSKYQAFRHDSWRYRLACMKFCHLKA
jgi:hypothetical protein